MPKKSKNLCVDDLRHAEYYGMQPVFDELYRRSLDGDNFTDLMDIILSRDNILLAYRNIKANGGSYTAGTDNKNISDIGCLPPETVADTDQNRSGVKTFQSQTARPARWVFPVSGTGWYSNVSSRSWSLSAKRNSATIATAFARPEPLRRTRHAENLYHAPANESALCD